MESIPYALRVRAKHLVVPKLFPPVVFKPLLPVVRHSKRIFEIILLPIVPPLVLQCLGKSIYLLPQGFDFSNPSKPGVLHLQIQRHLVFVVLFH